MPLIHKFDRQLICMHYRSILHYGQLSLSFNSPIALMLTLGLYQLQASSPVTSRAQQTIVLWVMALTDSSDGPTIFEGFGGKRAVGILLKIELVRNAPNFACSFD